MIYKRLGESHTNIIVFKNNKWVKILGIENSKFVCIGFGYLGLK
jgi:hypothetical protein